MGSSSIFVSLGTIAEVFAISISTARKWARNGTIPAIKLGGEYRVRRTDLARLVTGPKRRRR